MFSGEKDDSGENIHIIREGVFMETIQIQTASKTYPLFLGHQILDKLPEVIGSVKPDVSKVFIITDEEVDRLYGDALASVLRDLSPVKYVIPSGEHAKSFDYFYQCQTFALEHQLDRRSLILAFGGGVVGDLAGFVAATYMRGISFIQIPTTLLAHDSAVGGKVAINHALGKNMIGAFHQPEAVFYDVQFFESLPEREWRSGFGEVVKHALISDESFYRWLQDNITSLQHVQNQHLMHMIEKGIHVKAGIVRADERESGVRAFLNLGHTLGHAIESESGYGVVSHGEAVIIGMIFALEVSIELEGLRFDVEELKKWLTSLGYSVDVPKSLDHKRLLQKMQGDKKSTESNVNMVLLQAIGEPVMRRVDDETILSLLAK